MKNLSERTKKDIVRIIDLLRNEGQMHIRGISRALEIHPMTVSRLIDSYLSPFMEINEINEFGLKAKLVRLREDRKKITAEDVLKYVELRKKIRNNNNT